ncbi:MAG: hypothetical protein R3321_00360 [Nitrososphaeraceae archaeon]|nr:hypothetical protein [Nitrososphaeraceae archaeon]
MTTYINKKINLSPNEITHYCYILFSGLTLIVKWNGYRWYWTEEKETIWQFLSRLGSMNCKNVQSSWQFFIKEL